MIEGLKGGRDQLRSKVPSLYFGDEFAMQEEAKGVWTSLAPLVQKGMKLIIVSTPNGNLGDITYRAVEVLGRADRVLAEDTRRTSIQIGRAHV